MCDFYVLQEEYEDEVEDDKPKFEHALEEEDPEVIKELITLIKRVGGLDELEKQLQLRLNLNQKTSIDSKATTTTTTISPISQSLYNKVLGTKRGSLLTQKTSTELPQPLVQRQNKENRYSSVVRNSRPMPQNDGIDKLSEIESIGIIRERPQYITITRTQSPKTNEDDEPEYTVTESFDDDIAGEGLKTPTTHQPKFQYFNIQRARPSTIATNEDDFEDDDEPTEAVNNNPITSSTPRMQYVNIQRVRPTKQQYLHEIIESESPTPETK